MGILRKLILNYFIQKVKGFAGVFFKPEGVYKSNGSRIENSVKRNLGYFELSFDPEFSKVIYKGIPYLGGPTDSPEGLLTALYEHWKTPVRL
jgi:hypothetical protein